MYSSVFPADRQCGALQLQLLSDISLLNTPKFDNNNLTIVTFLPPEADFFNVLWCYCIFTTKNNTFLKGFGVKSPHNFPPPAGNFLNHEIRYRSLVP